MLKGATKTLTKIKKLLQAYASARLTCRFSLKVLKAKNENNNWVYVPSPAAVISDAAVKIVGKDASSCCFKKDVSSESGTLDGDELKLGGYHLIAFLPKPDAGTASLSPQLKT